MEEITCPRCGSSEHLKLASELVVYNPLEQRDGVLYPQSKMEIDYDSSNLVLNEDKDIEVHCGICRHVFHISGSIEINWEES